MGNEIGQTRTLDPKGAGLTPAEIITRANITSVAIALGVGPIRHGRIRAWWRQGDGCNVSLDDRKNTWFDHARGQGGGMLDLIGAVRGCSRAEALAWLADYVGQPLQVTTPETRRQWQCDRDERRAAELWARSAQTLAEILLENCPDMERAALTRTARISASGGPQLLSEYRAWRSATPELTAAMVKGGANADKRLQRALAALVSEWSVADGIAAA